MNTTDRATLGEWLDLELDGQLGANERARLAESLGEDPELAAEGRRLEALHALLAESAVPVRGGFREQVMARLPQAAWQPRRVPAWVLPAAMALAFGAAAALVLGGGAAADGPVVGTGLAVFDFLRASALAGAGLLAASWRGLGLGLEELIASSGLSLVAMAALVIFLNLLFISMLRRRPHDVQPILESTAADGEAECGEAEERRG